MDEAFGVFEVGEIEDLLAGGLTLGGEAVMDDEGQILELDGNSYRNLPRRPRATPAPPADDEA